MLLKYQSSSRLLQQTCDKETNHRKPRTKVNISNRKLRLVPSTAIRNAILDVQRWR